MTDRDVIAEGIRSYCAAIEVKSDGDKTPDPMWYAYEYADEVLAALADAGLVIVPKDALERLLIASLSRDRDAADKIRAILANKDPSS